jgi:hypothetical protein
MLKNIFEVVRLVVLMQLMSCYWEQNWYFLQGRGQACHIVPYWAECHNVAINVKKKIFVKYKIMLDASVVKLPFG